MAVSRSKTAMQAAVKLVEIAGAFLFRLLTHQICIIQLIEHNERVATLASFVWTLQFAKLPKLLVLLALFHLLTWFPECCQ